MRNYSLPVLLFLTASILAACGNSKDAATIYVLTPSQKASRFTQDLAVIAKRHGLTPNFGTSVPGDHGQKYFVIEASGRWFRLWSQNVPLSPENPGLCGHYTEAHPDPGQYVVTIDHGLGYFGLNHALAVIANGKPRLLAQEIGRELKASGYTVRTKPILCSPLSKTEASESR